MKSSDVNRAAIVKEPQLSPGLVKPTPYSRSRGSKCNQPTAAIIGFAACPADGSVVSSVPSDATPTSALLSFGEFEQDADGSIQLDSESPGYTRNIRGTLSKDI